MPTRIHRILTAGGLVVVSLLLCFVCGEIVIRLLGIQQDFFYQLDPEVGVTHIPHKKGVALFKGGHQYIQINGHGYRDRERSVQKAKGVFRIVLLGDSFVEAFQVPLERTVGFLLEERLNEGCQVHEAHEVLNFGVGGFATADELETFRHRALDFQPDAALLFMYPSNDIYDNSVDLDVEPNGLHYGVDADGQLRRLPFQVSDNRVKRWLRHHSKAYLFVRDRMLRIRAFRRSMERLGVAQRVADVSYLRHQQARRETSDNQYRPDVSEAVERAWRITIALIREFRDEARRNSVEMGVVLVPSHREMMNADGGLTGVSRKVDVRRSLRRLVEICRQLEVKYLDLTESFDRVGLPASRIYLPVDGHWTSEGHAGAADALADWLNGRICLLPEDMGRCSDGRAVC